MPLNLCCESAKDLVGRETGLSSWFEITQERIDAFADASGDHQWIHKNHPSTLAGPFGGPIAHGLLVLSLATKLAEESGALPESTWVLCGYDKLRFRAPVRSGQRIRCRTTLLSAGSLGKRLLLNVRFRIEIEHENTPALVTECALLCVERRDGKAETSV